MCSKNTPAVLHTALMFSQYLFACVVLEPVSFLQNSWKSYQICSENALWEILSLLLACIPTRKLRDVIGGPSLSVAQIRSFQGAESLDPDHVVPGINP